MTDRGLEPDLEKGCNSVLLRAEPIPLQPGVPYPNFVNRTNGSFYRKYSIAHDLQRPSQEPFYYPNTENSLFIRTHGYYNEADGKDCFTKMKMPACYALMVSSFIEMNKTLQGNVSRIHYFLPMFPRVAFAAALGATSGLTTCMLCNIPYFEERKWMPYFAGGYLSGFLYQLSRDYSWSLGRANKIGIVCGIIWFGINKSWYNSAGPLLSIDPQCDSDWTVNHLPRPNYFRND